MTRDLAALGVAGIVLLGCAAPPEAAPDDGPAYQLVTVPGATEPIKMLRIPAGPGVAPFWLAETELRWEHYDVFVYALDEGKETPSGADAFTRPSKPYIPPDRGFGHDGHPAISMTFLAAQEWCRWLAARTGIPFRLPAESEWEHACRAGAEGPYGFAGGVPDLAAHAWYFDVADDRTHPVAGKLPNAWGLYDMHGNAAEWCVADDGTGVLRGGSYRDDPPDLEAGARRVQTPSWNASDPQMPKSRWWLADAPFAGLRPAAGPTVPEQEPPLRQ